MRGWGTNWGEYGIPDIVQNETSLILFCLNGWPLGFVLTINIPIHTCITYFKDSTPLCFNLQPTLTICTIFTRQYS